MVEFSQTTPFVGVVNNARQRKLPKGTEVEVRAIKDGDYGPYALSFVEGRDKPVFLNPKHIDFVSDVSGERQAELDADKAAWFAAKNAPVTVGSGEVHPGGKSVVVNVVVDLESTDQYSSRRAFFPLSQVTEIDGVYHAPPWLAKIKAVEAAYYWLSRAGTKGVGHFGGAGIAAHYTGGPSYDVSLGDLLKAESQNRNIW